MKEAYTLNEVAQMSGLTTRTLRNYLSMGLLKGQRDSKCWSFTPEEISAFLGHPTVAPAIRAKRNGVVFDFLTDKRKKDKSICLILDLPDSDGCALSRQFTELFNQNEAGDGCTFSFDYTSGYSRVILTGPAEDVLALTKEFQAL